MRGLLVCVVLLLLSALASAQITDTVGPWRWELGPNPSFGILDDAGTAPSGGSPNDFADGWFFFYVDATILPYGGIQLGDKLGSSTPEYSLFKRTGSTIGSLNIDTTFRLEDNGFAIVLWEVTNTGAPQTFVLSNQRDNTGAGSPTVYQTFNGDLLVSAADNWIILDGGSSGVDIISFGEANMLDTFTFGVGSSDQVDWTKSVTINTGETTSILAAFGIDSVANLAATATHAHNILDSAFDFYMYVTPSGNRMLAHLTAAQLLDVVNWDFLAAGVGGDPHGVNIDGSFFELPNFAETYCLFHDRSLQVNIRVDGSYGMITEVVVFARHHGIVVYADVSSGVPQYFVHDRLLSVPTVEGEHRLISTRVAPFHFSSDPLKQLERYHENGMFLRQLVSIVGGIHPITGGFFNVAVHQRPMGDAEFPSILQLPSHPLRDIGYSVAAISNVWHDFAQ